MTRLCVQLGGAAILGLALASGCLAQVPAPDCETASASFKAGNQENVPGYMINGTCKPFDTQTLFLNGDPDLVDISHIPWAGFPELRAIDLKITGVEDLTPLAAVPKLAYLSISKTNVTDLTPLDNLTKLELLELWGTEVADVSPLRNLTLLRNLHLRETKVVDLSPLRDLASLEELSDPDGGYYLGRVNVQAAIAAWSP